MNYKKLLAAMIMFTSTAAHANIICPSTIKAGSPLVVNNIKIVNGSTSPMNINRVLTVIGNIDGKSLGFLGPYVTTLSPIFTVPAATLTTVQYGSCPSCSYIQSTATTIPVNNFTVMSSIPASMAGNIAVVSVAIMDTNSITTTLGACTVTVTN
jgi:hypothetical protein